MIASREDSRDWFDGFLTTSRFVEKYPFFTHILADLVVVCTDRVQVMGIGRGEDGRFRLYVNRDYFVGREKYLPGVVQHELHHAIYGHATDVRYRNAEHPDLMVLCTEMAANEHITEPLPGEPIRWQSYAKHGIRAGQSTLERYAILAEARKRGEHIDAGACPSDHLVRVKGGAADEAGPYGDLEDLARARKAHAETSELERLIAASRRSFLFDAHLRAGEGSAQVEQQLFATELPPEAPIDWRKALRNLVSSARTPTISYRHVNRRFPDRVGEIPGRAHTRSSEAKPLVITAIDTSASMSQEALEQIARELRLLERHARVTVVECDKEIGRVYPFDRKIDEIEGRGGTDLRPVFELDFLRRHRPAAVVYFTDGGGPYPEDDPGVRTLWVLTNDGLDFGCPWGDRAYMEVPEGEQPTAPRLIPPPLGISTSSAARLRRIRGHRKS